MSSIHYRSDIDGLRAVAVISVILFHLDPRYLQGGFLGVDVFFVISGFLITKIIITERLEARFSYSSFYVRRAKRILPPLFLMLTLTIIAAFIILLPSDLYKFGISLASVLVFLSNIQYALRTGDYFSGDSSEWPLLHTWSLAVEEQYYFILPLMVLLLLKTKHQRLLLAFTVLGIVSFIFAEIMSRTVQFSAASYYLIVTRMGELLIGSIIACAQVKNRLPIWHSQILTALSALCLLLMFFFVNEDWIFPGVIAIPLCLSIGVIINSKETLVNRILSHKYMVSIGLLSYSLYLIHWPILAMTRYVLNIEQGQHSLDLSLQFLLLTMIIVISLLSYRFVEKPLRKVNVSTKNVLYFYFLIPSFLLGLVSLVIISQAGIPQRFSTASINASLQFSHINIKRCPSLMSLGCVAGNPTSTSRIMMFGNSHAEHYFEYIVLHAQAASYRAELYAAGGCSVQMETTKCRAVTEAFHQNKRPDDVIVVAYRWDLISKKDELMASLAELTERLIDSHEDVVFLAQPPVLNINPSKLANCKRLNIECKVNIEFDPNYVQYNDKVRRLVEAKGAMFIDPYDALDDKFKISEGEQFYYADFDHLSVYGARWLYTNRANALESILNEAAE